MPTQVMLGQPREGVTLHLGWITRPPMSLLLSFTKLQLLAAVRGTTQRDDQDSHCLVTYEQVKDPGCEGLEARKADPQVLQQPDENFHSAGKRPSSGKGFGQMLPHLSARAEAISNSVLSPFSPFKFAYLR